MYRYLSSRRAAHTVVDTNPALPPAPCNLPTHRFRSLFARRAVTDAHVYYRFCPAFAAYPSHCSVLLLSCDVRSVDAVFRERYACNAESAQGNMYLLAFNRVVPRVTSLERPPFFRADARIQVRSEIH